MAESNIVYSQIKIATKTDANLDEVSKKLKERYKRQPNKPRNNVNK